MDFGASGSGSSAKKAPNRSTSYLPGDLDQFAKLMTFDGSGAASGRDSDNRHNNAPTEPPRVGFFSGSAYRTYTATDEQIFEQIAMRFPGNAVFESNKNGPPATLEDSGQRYEQRDLEAFEALAAVPARTETASGPDRPVKPVKEALPYAPPSRPAPKDYFGIRTVDSDAELPKERQYFSASRPEMKIVYSDAVGKKW